VAAPTADAFASAAAYFTAPRKSLIWRPDVDPVALPQSEAFTPSQRAILHACVELFADVGYAGTSVRDIAARVGIKSASLYKSFPSKQAMLDALSDIGHTEFGRRQISAILGGGDDARDQLTAGVRALVVMTCEFPRLARIVNTEVRNLSATGFDRDQKARLQSAQILREVLERGVEQGLFPEADFSAITVLLWGLGVALAGWFPYSAADVTIEHLADSYADIALRIVGASREPEARTNGRRGR
jgi:AcrR family transcriptional regulator